MLYLIPYPTIADLKQAPTKERSWLYWAGLGIFAGTGIGAAIYFKRKR